MGDGTGGREKHGPGTRRSAVGTGELQLQFVCGARMWGEKSESSDQRRASSVERPASSVQHRAASIQRPSRPRTRAAPPRSGTQRKGRRCHSAMAQNHTSDPVAPTSTYSAVSITFGKPSAAVSGPGTRQGSPSRWSSASGSSSLSRVERAREAIPRRDLRRSRNAAERGGDGPGGNKYQHIVEKVSSTQVWARPGSNRSLLCRAPPEMGRLELLACAPPIVFPCSVGQSGSLWPRPR
jgi:hypothetical protein